NPLWVPDAPGSMVGGGFLGRGAGAVSWGFKPQDDVAADPVWVVCRHIDADLLRLRASQPLVDRRLRRVVRPRLPLRLSARRLAVRPGRSGLGVGCAAPVAVAPGERTSAVNRPTTSGSADCEVSTSSRFGGLRRGAHTP